MMCLMCDCLVMGKLCITSCDPGWLTSLGQHGLGRLNSPMHID